MPGQPTCHQSSSAQEQLNQSSYQYPAAPQSKPKVRNPNAQPETVKGECKDEGIERQLTNTEELTEIMAITSNADSTLPQLKQLWNPTAISLCSLLHREDIQGRWIEIVLARAKQRSSRQRKNMREKARREKHVIRTALSALPTDKDIIN